MTETRTTFRTETFTNLTSFSSPAQSPVLPEDSANSVPVVGQRHRSLISEPLFVIPHEGAVADLSTCRKTHGKDELSVTIRTHKAETSSKVSAPV